MKVAFICTEKLPVPPVAGGAIQLYIDGIVPYLAKLHDITVYSIKYPGLADEETRDNVKYIRVAGKTGAAYLENLKSVLDCSYDLVHVFNRPLFLHGLSESFPELKFSLSLHNEMFHREKISDETALKCIEKAEFINTVSRYIANTVIQRFPSAEEKMRVVYSGADPDKYHPCWTDEGSGIKREMKTRYGVENCNVVLNVGRLSVKKGVHILVKAMEKVMAGHPDTALVIVGSKWYGSNETDEYTAYVKSLSKKLPGPVIFTGFVPPHEIPGYYCMGDIFVCASQWNEPLARVHYEAMASGLPIITTNRGGNAEVVSGFGNGVVIDEYNNPDAMAEEISQLLDDPAKGMEMGMKGRKLAEEEFNWEKVASRILGVAK
ncbi:MAG: glycosyltransferase family 4 protein [Acetivibrionales bacterium]